jgi:hypothetical protein
VVNFLYNFSTVEVVGWWVGFWCGRAKLNVVFLCREVWWQNTSLNFAEALAFLFFCRYFVGLQSVFLQ